MTSNLERHVTNLKTSQALFNAGIRHEGEPLYWWVYGELTDDRCKYLMAVSDHENGNELGGFPAFLLSELMEVLNADEKTCPEGYDLRFYTYPRKFGDNVMLSPFGEEDSNKWLCASNPIEAVASLLLAGKK
jgi:hypothetical protein